MQSIKSLSDRNLSYYRTEHYFARYAEFASLEDYKAYYQWSKKQGVKLYILGNGSNTLYQKQKVKSLILKNKLPKKIEALSANRFEVSSTVLVLELLKACVDNSLDSFYYLASVPATIGGALAMNAGRGRKHNITIYDFVESVSFYDHESDTVKTLGKGDIVQGYRKT
ncbi:MAG: FAD-binding protein, partial [Moorea sp. SIO4G2]|nr:FAD-binding protein [Moorena sp. SIO4G2]